MTTRQPTPGVHENFAAKISPEAHAAHEAGLEAAALAALGHDHLLEVMMDLPEFKYMFSRSLKAYLSASGLALTPAPVPHLMGRGTAEYAAAEADFTEYFVRNYPGPDTVIFDPKWHAPKIFAAAAAAIRATTKE
jgi:hypothetical protein